MQYYKRDTDATVKTRIGDELEYAEPYGVQAVAQFEGKETISVIGQYVPFHAVDTVVIEDAITQKEKPNPRFCEAGEGGSSKVCEATVCDAQAQC